jgi:hypothetical protein
MTFRDLYLRRFAVTGDSRDLRLRRFAVGPR